MTYCVYFKATGALQSIIDRPPTSDELGYIKISNEQTELFLTGTVRMADYRVVPDTGKLVSYKQISVTRYVADDIIFAVPKDLSKADFIITQNIQDKTCTARIGQHGKLVDGIVGITIAACKPNVPYSPLWIWDIKFSDLLDNDVKINYTGTDNIMFYTKKNFNTYSHETI
jgi:hypothetical protein